MKVPSAFPQRLKKQNNDECFVTFLSLLKKFHIDLPSIDILQGIPKYAKYINNIVSINMRLIEYENVVPT